MTGTASVTAPNADNIRGPITGADGDRHHRYYETAGKAGLAKTIPAVKGTKSFHAMKVPAYTNWNHYNPAHLPADFDKMSAKDQA